MYIYLPNLETIFVPVLKFFFFFFSKDQLFLHTTHVSHQSTAKNISSKAITNPLTGAMRNKPSKCHRSRAYLVLDKWNCHKT